MTSTNTSERPTVGVVGAGAFGSAIANLLAENQPVLLYTRLPEVYESVMADRMNRGRRMHDNMRITMSLEEVANECSLIYPILPSSNFREKIRELAPFLTPEHILIHGTKGVDVQLPRGEQLTANYKLNPKLVNTMTEVMLQETIVRRVGCLAGPNLASEILAGQPAATVIASEFDEVIRLGQRTLRTPNFQVFSSHDRAGVEIAGVLKNVIAIAAGALEGLGLGENARALLISRGLVEMVHVGKHLGGGLQAFLGLAGVGDLIATCSSPNSRNFSVGYRIAKGESLEDILNSMEEVAEGINTVKISRAMANHLGFRAPLTETIYEVLFGGKTAEEALEYLMKFPYYVDVDVSIFEGK
ncbi:MAG: NAD(P)-dependent glycerol-3-phosphate dehydrogenase [Flavobacteriales bacterium]|nr:NAD(P)-dependent glycerol-3-phosphate dehydrogenase [Flavobacteriales bacterium]